MVYHIRFDNTRDPLTRLASADENASSSHPLPQGGEGSQFNSPLAPLGERGLGVRGSRQRAVVEFYTGHHTRIEMHEFGITVKQGPARSTPSDQCRYEVLRAALSLAWILSLLAVVAPAQDAPPAAGRYEVQTDGADWHLKGDGMVCCPCTTPCPCRTNGKATYGHCEATLFLRIQEGHYGDVKLDGLQLVDTSGACAMNYKQLAALYFDQATNMAERVAFMKLLASFFSDGAASFPYVRMVPLKAEITGDRFFRVVIPDILEIGADRNWGKPSPPFPMVAATDHFSNALQYAQNIRYKMHDEQGHLNFDYSRRQANYRVIDLDSAQYRSKSMLIQYLDGKGGFNDEQLRLIEQQHLLPPDLPSLRQLVERLR